MKERPILFSGEMVRAILDGRKTQTRRVIKMPSHKEGAHIYNCPYGKTGDRLWVRETFGYISHSRDKYFAYRADERIINGTTNWKPSIHMPRIACRVMLEITDTWPEPLQDISDADCFAEGVPENCDAEPRDIYMRIWEGINGKESWDKNPLVWVIDFKRVNL